MKKTLLPFFLLCVCFAFCSKSKNGTTPDPDPPPPPPPPPPAVYKPHFYVDGTTLRDSSGKAFLMRGNNFPVFWFPNDYKPSLKAAATLGCNAARLVWMVETQAWTPALSVLDDAIATCIANKMVPIVELHDFTGGTDASNINTAVSYYTRTDVKAMMDKYSAFVILNIANEWGSGNTNSLAWRNAYLPAILNLRNAGYKIPIMIDAPGYGQNETAIVDYGKNLLDADPEKNLIFSTHAYSNWNDASTYSARIDNILSKNLCLVFGEFGWNVPDDQQPTDFVCKVNAPLLMQLCQTKKVGYLGWSWKGNNDANLCFDMCTSWSDTSRLTTWGRQWAYDVNGVKNTGVPAAAFP
ncbi:MAG: glycoside hydrolase family 5 protein [Chitinophagaceae bacterium]|nr:glycoside hydrolase family 5 protein [Chitinophagaceae bacterium]